MNIQNNLPTCQSENPSLKKQPLYFENLDGLRFFAFLAVFISHASLFLGYNNNFPVFVLIKNYILINGDIGVSFFFVLSGFLITYLLLREKDVHGHISLKNFYIRRILRIWPVYFTTLIIGFFIVPVVVPLIAGLFVNNGPFVFLINPSFTVLPQYLLFLANFNLAFSGGSSVPTDVLWSISVEEQFYLVWPFVIAFLPRKHLLKFLGSIVLISCVYRYFYAFSPNVIAYSTFSVMSDLAIGSVLAYLVYTKNTIIDLLRSTPRKVIVGIYAFLFLLVFGRHYISYALTGHNILFSLFVSILPIFLTATYAFIILEQNEMPRSLFKIGKSKTLSFLGKISYGLYSYHMFAFIIVLLLALGLGFNLSYSSALQWIILATLSLITVFILAIISYYGMEKVFLKNKPKD